MRISTSLCLIKTSWRRDGQSKVELIIPIPKKSIPRTRQGE